METQYVRPDGTPIPDGVCVKADNVVDTFTVETRSLNGVTKEQLTALLQQRFEVPLIMHTKKTIVVK